MSVALYRKYRPKSFSEVTGQDHIKKTLQNEIAGARLGHAYLFCGPRGTGKTTLARLFAKSVNCTSLGKMGEPCNECPSCLDIIENRSLDVLEIDAASHTGVDNVRENIINNARFSPTSCKYKVFIIDEVHMLSTAAFNALLKTLEEPPKYIIFILATTEAHKLPATIISRCQRFDFHKVNFTDLVERLRYVSGREEVEVEDAALGLIARNAGGCVRDAESLLEQIMSIGDKKITLEQAELILPKSDDKLLFDFFARLVAGETREAISLINQLSADGYDLQKFLDNFIEFVRKILLFKLSGNKDELLLQTESAIVVEIEKILPNVTVTFLSRTLEESLKNKDLYKQSLITQLPLEITAIRLTLKNEAPLRPSVAAVVSAPMVRAEELKIKNPTLKIEERQLESIQELSVKEEIKNVGDPVTIVENIVEEPAPIVRTETGPMTLQEIKAQWICVLESVKAKNYSLYMSLRMSKPIGLFNNVLKLGFLFELQKGRVERPENMAVVLECLKTLGVADLTIAAAIDPSLTIADFSGGHSGDGLPKFRQDKSLESSIDEVANQFGGEVVG